MGNKQTLREETTMNNQQQEQEASKERTIKAGYNQHTSHPIIAFGN
jgi:hypothetical protein